MAIDPARMAALHAEIAAVCPILGVSVGDPADHATWRVDFGPGATVAQRAAAHAIVAGHAPLTVDVDPPSIPPGEFFQRFTAAERQALWTACVADPIKGAGLIHFMTAATVFLPAPGLKAWMDSLVPAVITAARETVILTP